MGRRGRIAGEWRKKGVGGLEGEREEDRVEKKGDAGKKRDEEID